MKLNFAEIIANQPPPVTVELLPEMRYGGVCTGFIIKPAKSGDGTVAHLEWTILAPSEYRDRKVKAFFVLEHSKMDVAQRGLHALARCAQACGLPAQIDDGIVFVGRKAVLDIVIEGKSATYPYDSNKIKRFLAPTTMPTAPQAPADPARDAYYATGGVAPTPNPITHPQSYGYGAGVPIADDIPF